MRVACRLTLHGGAIRRAATLRHDPPRIWQQAAAAQRLRHTAPPGPSVRAASGSPAGGGDADGDACSSWDTTNAALWDTQSELWDAGASSCSGWLLSEAPSATASAGASSSGRPYDAILMLGGGLLPTGALPEWVVRRLEGCLYLYRQQTAAAAGNGASPGGSGDTTSSGSSSSAGNSYTAAGGAAGDSPAPSIVLLGAGTPHKPPVIDEGGWVVHESTAYAAYLLRRGVPAAHLLKEAQSYDTVGNGYFSLLMHALPAGWRRIAVVTSEFHMPRTRATFDFVYGLAGRQLYGDEAHFSLDYQPVSDAGIFDAQVLEARREKEAEAVAAWHRNTAGMHSLADLHSWLYATHLCYSVSRQHEFGRERGLDTRLAATY